MISISPMTGTGEKKCRPMKRGRAVRGGGEPGDGDAAGVARENRVRVRGLSLRAAHVSRLSGSSSKTASMTRSWPCRAVRTNRSRHTPEDLLRARLVQLPLLDLARQVARDAVATLLGELRGSVREGDLLAGRRGHLGDAIPHQAGADDEDPVDAHWAASLPAGGRSDPSRRSAAVIGSRRCSVTSATRGIPFGLAFGAPSRPLCDRTQDLFCSPNTRLLGRASPIAIGVDRVGERGDTVTGGGHRQQEWAATGEPTAGPRQHGSQLARRSAPPGSIAPC